MNASALLTSRARLSGPAVGVVDAVAGRSFTFDELDLRANRTASVMMTRFGVGRGDRVALLAENSIAYVDLLYGLSRIGALFVPLNWRLTESELLPMIRDCSPKVLLFGALYFEKARSLGAAAGVQHVVSMDLAPGGTGYEEELNAISPLAVFPADVLPGDPLAILYTSGTTGTPKGAVIPHRQMIWNCINTTLSWGLTALDVSPIFTPMFHAGGLFVFLTPLLYVGGKVVITSGLDAPGMLGVIAHQRCTVTLGVPTLFQTWLQEPVLRVTDFSHVRWFISGGAPCPPSLVTQWREKTGTVLRQGYGLTEAGVNCFSMSDKEAVARAGSVGKPIFHSEMRIVDAAGSDVARGETGELLIRGDHVFTGYWNNPAATAGALSDGWLRTGDMAKQDADGFFSIVGRYKDMIISGGENIYAAEVESVFKAHPAVADAALVGESDERWGEVGVIAVVLKKNMTATSAELLGACDGVLARYKTPKRVVICETLPTSPYGKVMKAELKKMIAVA